MDCDRSHPNRPEFMHSTVCNPESASGMFSHCRGFTVTGQTFTNISHYNTAPSVPSDYRMIPFADIDLRREIRVDEYRGFLNHQPRARVRRIYSARVEGRKSRVTAAMYQGDGAEEEWRDDVAKYMAARHPNIIQIAGAANSDGIHATLFHDELIPANKFLQLYQHSHFLKVHVYACYSRDFDAGYDFLFLKAFQLAPWDCTSWIRHSTGQLCLDPTQPSGNYVHYLFDLGQSARDAPDTYALSANRAESIKKIIDSLSIRQYHNIISMCLARYPNIRISAAATVKLGRVMCFSSSQLLEDSAEIASLSDTAGAHISSENWSTYGRAVGEVIENGWTRSQSGDILPDGIIELSWWNHGSDCWLSQANHIFRQLQITSNFEDYIYLSGVHFRIRFLETTEDVPAGFLFLCPVKDFEAGPLSFRWPDCTAYWSVDPSGVDRLSPEEATQLGFPPFQLTARAWGYSWDASVYEGLCQFHEAKGFDPHTQDLARHLGYPVYQISSEVDTPFAHGDFNSASESDCEAAWMADEGPALEDLVDNDELSYFEEDHLDLLNISGGCMSEPAEILTGQDHSSELIMGQDTVEIPMLDEEMPAASLTFKFLMNIQLVLILFLALSWLYNHFDSGK